MKCMKRMALAAIAGAAFALAVPATSSAAPLSQAAGAAPAAVARNDGNLIEVGRRHRHWHGHRHRHHHHGALPWLLFAAPFFYDDYYY